IFKSLILTVDITNARHNSSLIAGSKSSKACHHLIVCTNFVCLDPLDAATTDKFRLSSLCINKV
ncbi:hypothetical protein, partial [Pseudoalteromonas citrea]|uniref:hypothetical protein n=1 Tax=Pseudoalteromonas citrea TaxID=43655 RepID=UPI001BB2AD7A